MGSEGRTRATFRVLGPVELRTETETVVLTGRQGALLTILLLNANRVVSVRRLAEALWGEPLPNSPSARVRMLISDLRKTCAAAGDDLIRTQRPGYVAHLPPAALDLTRFIDGVAQARKAAAREDLETALAGYDEALSLWHGAPLAGIDGAFVAAEVARLEELRLEAVEERGSALLALGKYAEAVTELTTIVQDHPLREAAHGRLMLALHRSGRRADALAVYRRLRERISEELGLEPERDLQRLHQQILTSDTEPEAPRASTPSQSDASEATTPEATDPEPSTAILPTPRQLPAPPPHFVGRARERAALDHLARTRDTTPTVPMAAISGTGGMGKTALALHWAHGNLAKFPDGQLYVNLHGFDPTTGPLPPQAALRHFLASLGVPATTMPTGEEAQSGLYRSLVADRRLLIVLDNARDTAQVEPLLPGAPGCVVLITSRNRLSGLNATHGASLIGLDALTRAETRAALVHHLGDRDPASLAVLVEHTGGLPLAISVLTARAAMHPGFPLSVLAEELRSPSTRLDALQTGGGDLNTDLRATFTASYEALDPAAARLFTLLGLAPWPDLGLPSAAALAGLPPARTKRLLHDLEAANLVDQHRPGRYRTHDLIRLYAAERAHTDRPGHERTEALTRLIDAYVTTACAADRLLYPNRPFAADPTREEFEDAASAWAWFEDEQPGLMAVQQLAVKLGMDVAVWRLAWATDTYHKRCQHELRIESWQTALAAAERLRRPSVRAFAHWYLGYAYAQAARAGEGVEHLLLAYKLFEQEGDRAGQAHTSHTLGFAWIARGEPERAVPHIETALRLQRELGDTLWEANALSAAGWCQARLGRYGAARAYCEQALELFQRYEDLNGESATLDSLGYIAHWAGRHDEALGYYGRCLELRESLGNSYQGADTLARIGDVQHDMGRPAAARDSWHRALDLYRRQHRTAEAESVQGKIRRLAGRPSAATGPAGHAAPAGR